MAVDDVAVSVKVAVPLDTITVEAVMPIGAVAGTVPAESEYHRIVPARSFAIPVVVIGNVAVPAMPTVIVPLGAPTVTVFSPVGVGSFLSHAKKKSTQRSGNNANSFNVFFIIF
jgi:thiazole synthase ThiGH ThiG subunit